MTTTKYLSYLIGSIALCGAMTAVAEPHWGLPSCYIHVHDGCYNNTDSPCTDDEYNDFLDGCDVAYPQAGPSPARLPITRSCRAREP
ncbi:MAG: hypothetical protein OES09_15940 [Gammaproteobacteria bacterium]|nr:hypothetical protein [Gammaproteobacteria bacterium]